MAPEILGPGVSALPGRVRGRPRRPRGSPHPGRPRPPCGDPPPPSRHAPQPRAAPTFTARPFGAAAVERRPVPGSVSMSGLERAGLLTACPGAWAGLAPKSRGLPELAEMKSAERRRTLATPNTSGWLTACPPPAPGCSLHFYYWGRSRASSSSPLEKLMQRVASGRLLGGGDSVVQVARVRSGS